jgi:hypothetical protein
LNQRGFAMITVMVAVAMAGALAYYLMQTSDLLGKIDDKEMINFDRSNLETELKLILQSESNCALSFKNDFTKSAIHDPDSQEGLPIEIWMGQNKKIQDGDTYYKLKILSLRLFMDQGEAANFPEGHGTELGHLKVRYNAASTEMNLNIPISVSFRTNSTGLSSVLGCRPAVAADLCQSVGMLYNATTGQCTYEEVCDGQLSMAGEDGEEDWIGERSANCSDNLGSHMRDISLSQMRTNSGIDTNGMKIKCCAPKTDISVRCFNYQEIAQPNDWQGDVQAYCNMRAGGYLQGLLLSQMRISASSTEVNGLVIRCCYPY